MAIHVFAMRMCNKMSEITTWPGMGWKSVRLLGIGSYGKVYEIKREEFGQNYTAALKVITIPQHSNEITNAFHEGMSHKEVEEYFGSTIQEITREFAIMAELKGHSNIVSYEDHMVIPHDDGIGADILLRMELLHPLMEWSREHPFSEDDVIDLGCDICRALEICHGRNIIHRDVKPGNIFVNDFGNYKLGDFGIARTIERTMSNLSMKGTFTNMAPEVHLGQEYGFTVDVYSLGTVLYQFLNNNRSPFLPVSGPINLKDRMESLEKRMHGEKIPEPVHGSPALKQVVLKAMEFSPNDRYKTPKLMREDLEKCRNYTVSINNPQDTDSCNAITADHHTETERMVTDSTPQNVKENRTGRDSEAADKERKKRNNIIWLLPAIVLLAAVSIFAVSFWPQKQNSEETLAADDSSDVTEPLSEEIQIEVPEGIGLTAQEYKKITGELGLTVTEIESYSEDTEPGIIITQEPEAGTALHREDSITITVSKGPEPFVIDDYIGKQLESVQSVLKELNIEIDIVEEYSDEVEEGTIISQTPASGSTMTKGDTVVFIVSKGPEEIKMPDIVGKTQEEAEAIIRELGMTEGKVTKLYRDSIPAGEVVRQDIEAGTTLEPGTEITFAISIGPEPKSSNTGGSSKKSSGSKKKKSSGSGWQPDSFD